MFLKRLLAVVLLYDIDVMSEFTDHFNYFLRRHYSKEFQVKLERLDMGYRLWGSFGGKLNDNDPITKTVSSVITFIPFLVICPALLRMCQFVRHVSNFLHR